MGNGTGRMEAGPDDGGVGNDSVGESVRSNGDIAPGENRTPLRYGAGRVIPEEVFLVQFRSPMLISPQGAFERRRIGRPRDCVARMSYVCECKLMHYFNNLTPNVDTLIAPSHKNDGSVSFSQTRQSDSQDPVDPNEGIPIIITWNYGGSDVLVEGSWDNWTSKKRMQRSGKACSILFVLPAGIYHYKFIVDGEYRYVPELPHTSDVSNRICNLLDIHEYVPEYPESIAEFEAPPSPESSYRQVPSGEEDFAKEPLVVPPHLHLTVLGPANAEEPVPSRPQHVVLNHLFLEKGRSSQSAVALGLTHRFKSKYVTVVLYKPVRR